MIFDSRDSDYKKPYGAAKAGEAVWFRVELPRDCPPPALELFLNNAETPVCAVPMQTQETQDGTTDYSCTFLPHTPGRYLYRFRTGERLLLRGERGEARFDTGDLWQLTIYDPAYETPADFAGAVFYQIFPDRFCNSGAEKKGVPADRLLHARWDEPPKDAPDPDGEFRCNDYFGGDLAGITERLPQLAELGVQALYLNPIFEAHSNHRYNTADYDRIDPLLGDESDFRALCAAAKKLDIKIILDGVFNHTGSDSVYFNREGRYGEKTGAWRDEQSPYRGWYRWDGSANGYASWWGFPTLPETEEDSSFRDYICGENGVLRRWLRAGASGWRLDVADELSDSFIRDIRAAVKAENPDALLLGEVWEDASAKFSGGEQRQYLMGRELDAVMNYPWREAILGFIRNGGGAALCEAIESVLECYPPQTVSVLLNILSTHDVPRAVTALGGEEQGKHGRDWQRAHNTLSPEQYYRGRQFFLLASVLQFTLPGCPCVYYGDEAGLVGYADPFNRGSYPWGREDAGLRDCIGLLGRLRRESETLRTGRYRGVCFDDDTACFLRESENETILICVNRGEDDRAIPWTQEELSAAEPLLDIGHRESGRLLGHSAVILRLPQKKENA